MTLEQTIERRCKYAAENNGGEWVKLLPFAVTGLPDRMLLLPGRWIAFVETKSPTGRLRPRQEWWKRRLTELGFHYVVIRYWYEFEALLEKWKSEIA